MFLENFVIYTAVSFLLEQRYMGAVNLSFDLFIIIYYFSLCFFGTKGQICFHIKPGRELS